MVQPAKIPIDCGIANIYEKHFHVTFYTAIKK